MPSQSNQVRTVPASLPPYEGSGALSEAGDVCYRIWWEEGARVGEPKAYCDSLRQDIVPCGNDLARWLG